MQGIADAAAPPFCLVAPRTFGRGGYSFSFVDRKGRLTVHSAFKPKVETSSSNRCLALPQRCGEPYSCSRIMREAVDC
jgi:hypothetical protein